MSTATSRTGVSAPLSRRDALTKVAIGAGAAAAAIALPAVPEAFAASVETNRTAKGTVNIGSKDFTENQIIAYMYSQLLQQHGIANNVHNGIASAIISSALMKGQIDLYPEYTGTGIVDVLKMNDVPHDAITYYSTVAAQYEKKYHITWLNPSPMNDTQGLATTQAVSKKYGIKTISDMVKNASKLRFIANSEFLTRPDGLPGLKKTYGNFKFKSTFEVAGAGSARYAALRRGQGDIVVAFTTDGPIVGDNLVLLKDDKNYAPPDNVAPIVRDSILNSNAGIRTALNALAPLITTGAIQKLNYQADSQHKNAQDLAKSFLKQHGLM